MMYVLYPKHLIMKIIGKHQPVYLIHYFILLFGADKNDCFMESHVKEQAVVCIK